jgi:hypothetical protein
MEPATNDLPKFLEISAVLWYNTPYNRMRYTTMTTNNDPRPILHILPALNHTFLERLFDSQLSNLNLFGCQRTFLPEARSFLPKSRALNWLCIGFELALFFLTSHLPILAYRSIKKALIAIFQMLRLALFSQTNPILKGTNPNTKDKLQTDSKIKRRTNTTQAHAIPPTSAGIIMLSGGGLFRIMEILRSKDGFFGDFMCQRELVILGILCVKGSSS